MGDEAADVPDGVERAATVSTPRSGRALVVTDPMLLIRHGNGRLILAREGTTVTTVPLRGLAYVALHGPITLTGAATAALLDAGIDVTLHTSHGRLRGMLSSMAAKNVYLVLAQAEAWRTPARRVAFAQALVASKLQAQRQYLQRQALDHASTGSATAVRRIDALRRAVAAESDIEALRGIEGAAAAAYFEAFATLIDGGWGFRRRARRPPPDPVNALLSFGYTLATGEVARHLLRAGFDLRIGLFHGLRYGRESLPLDLVDEFRVPMVDRFTLGLLRRRQVQLEDFVAVDTGGVRLTDPARRRYLELWEEMLDAAAPALRGVDDDDGDGDGETQVGAEEGVGEGRVTWRRRMQRQVGRLYRFLMRGEGYRGLLASGPGGAPAMREGDE